MTNNLLDLTQEETNLLNDLKDPDYIDPKSNNNHYSFDEEIQREILSLITNDKYFLTQSFGLIKPSYFTNQCHQLVSKILYKYFETYKQIPSKTIVLNELNQSIKDKEDAIKAFYIGEFNTVYKYYLPGLESREYYLDKITNFAKGMAVKNAFSKCLEEFSKAPESEETWVNIENIIKKALSVNRNFDTGLDYFQTYEERYERMKLKKESGDFFITGFRSIDESLAGGGLARGEIGSVIGLPGTGKSIFLVNAAIANMHRGKKILYISLELNDDKCAERFDAQLANPNPYGDNSTGISTKNLYENKEYVFKSLEDYVADKDQKNCLIIKQFPSGQMGMAELRAYYAQLIISGYQPDIVLVDYLGEMKDYPGMPIHESRPKMVRDLRGFAVENNICVMTAMQVDGKSRESIRMGGIIDDDNLAEAKGQNRPLDALWSINQLQEERECSLARVFVIKHRDGKARFICHIEFDYNTLKMREISQNKYTTIFNRYKNEKQITVAEHQSKLDEVDRIVGGNKNKEKTQAAVAAFVDDVGYNDVEDAPIES
jgi:replicative DNA helicase